ncbi:PREDICTED: ovalbumin-like [Elephantulus edwardii]|uniref:ovalbumin-like n=1 Tax=Elephantulus edwardii TaxID=28737 RepID=UPI0003F0860C|nr:PREDICTED: ovalbumin-like [Elephantulus edwardii]
MRVGVLWEHEAKISRPVLAGLEAFLEEEHVKPELEGQMVHFRKAFLKRFTNYLNLSLQSTGHELYQTPGRAMDSFSVATAQFCFDVFKEMSSDHTTENLVFSPLGLLSTLAMVLLGARGNSASEMKKCGPGTGVHAYIQAILSEISTSSRGQVYMASGIFADTTHPFLQKYLNCLEQLYKVKPENLDFKNSIDEARLHTNSWVQNKTNGFTGGFQSQEKCSPWVTSATPSGLKSQALTVIVFSSQSGSKVVQMRRLQGVFKLGSIEEPGVQVLEVPDVEGHLTLVIILPGENVGLGQVIREVTFEKLKTWVSLANMADTAVDLRLPQLRLEGSQEDLTSIMGALGMTDVLDPSLANLSGITAGGGLVVSKIFHRPILQVTEGDSGSFLSDPTGPVDNPEIVQVDRPFLMAILWKKTYTILFYAAVTNP